MDGARGHRGAEGDGRVRRVVIRDTPLGALLAGGGALQGYEEEQRFVAFFLFAFTRGKNVGPSPGLLDRLPQKLITLILI